MFAVVVTVVVGGTAVGVLPQLKNTDAAVGDTRQLVGPASIETAVLSQLDIPRTEARASLKTTLAEPPVIAGPATPALPSGSGSGYRIVFDESEQRVWLVGGGGAIERTYRVSGSRFENLEPGSYAVQSKSRTATAFDGSGTMEFFVRFATGATAPIGFHSVPVDNAGVLEQTRAQLGIPLSAGCVRQWRPDAISLWDFASIGTKVVVTA